MKQRVVDSVDRAMAFVFKISVSEAAPAQLHSGISAKHHIRPLVAFRMVFVGSIAELNNECIVEHSPVTLRDAGQFFQHAGDQLEVERADFL